jgi:hypothetical protein
MSTVRVLIGDAMKEIGALAAGETPSADEANDCLRKLNQLLDSWSTEKLSVFIDVTEENALTSDQSLYEMGPDADDFDTVRPISIRSASLKEPSADIEYPVEIIGIEEWRAIADKTQTGRPTKLYVNAENPIAELNFYPVPDQAYELTTDSQKRIGRFTSLSTEVEFPEGYDRAIVKNLALDICNLFGKVANARLEADAIQSKATIKKSNLQNQEHLMSIGSEYGTKKKAYNIREG